MTLEQQLATQAAQIEMMRDGLKHADDLLRTSYDHVSPLIREALSTTPDQALREWLGEPVAWMITYDGKCMGFVPTEEANTVAVYSPKGLK